MARDTDQQSESGIDRRTYLSALAAAGGTAVAGCIGEDDDSPGDDSDPEELGERVPTVELEFWGGLGGLSDQYADAGEIIQSNWTDALGVEVEVDPKDVGTLVNQLFDDARENHLALGGSALSPARLDPMAQLNEHLGLNSGATTPPSYTQYVGCDYTRAALESEAAGSEEERRELVHEAYEHAAEDVAMIPLSNYVEYGAFRNDILEIDDPGFNGAVPNNYDLLVNGISTDEPVVMSVTASDYADTLNHWTVDGGNALAVWNSLIYSPLVTYDRNYEMVNVLAEDYEVSDGFQTVTVTIRDHTDENGDPITAEDVKWTFEFVHENAAQIVRADEEPYDSIEVLDDRTVEFNFTRPNPSFVTDTMVRWGVVPKDVWIEAGAEETDPLEIEMSLDAVATTGPFTFESFSSGESVFLTPRDDHWDAPDYPIQIIRFEGGEAANRAFRDGDINYFTSTGAAIAHRLQEEMEEATVTASNGFTTNHILPQHTHGPGKFKEFRLAASQCLDRREINQVVFGGDAEMQTRGAICGTTHPFYPDDDSNLREITPSLEGDAEVARETLEEAGWGWDGDGNLHYPPDANLEPLFPQGDSPLDHPDEFPCLVELQEEFRG